MKRADAVPSLLLAVALVGAAEVRGDSSDTTYVTSLPRIGVVEQNGWWSDRGELVLGGLSGEPPIRKPLTLDGRRSEHGVYLHARPHGESSISYKLGKRSGTLRSDVLVPEMLAEQGSPRTPLVFEVRGDGRTLWKSKPLGRKGERQSCSVSIEGVEELSLVVICRGPENWGLAAWIEPRLVGGGLDGRTTGEAGTRGVISRSKVEAEVDRQSTVIPEGRFGFRFFPDQPVAVIREKPLLFTMVVTNQTWLMRGDSFEDARPVRVILEGSHIQGSYDEKYSGINSIFVDPTNQRLLAFTHNEKPTGGVNERNGVVRFHATVGLAVSTGREIRFQKVGPIISGVPEDPGSVSTAQGVCSPSACTDSTGEWIYLYYMDQSRIDPLTGEGRGVVTCVARSRVADGGAPGTWKKYYNGSFGEPGLGGRDSAVADCGQASTSYIPEMSMYVMVGNRHGICFFTSEDGVHWTRGGTLVEANDVPVVGEPVAFHPRFLVERATAESVTGQLVYAYSPRFSRPRLQAPGQTHFFVKRPVRFRLAR